MFKQQPRPRLRFIVHVTDHCNLNCKGCGHYSPIAIENYLDPVVFERDCKRLSELTDRKIERIELMGGEPLLHPQLIDIICTARKYFEGKITLVTNGIQLLKQNKKFWETCRECRIDIDMTVYPIKVDFEKIKNIARQYGVLFIHRGMDNPRMWYRNYHDISGNQNINTNFEICQWGNACIFLEDGKLSTCVVPLVIKHFNAYFGDTFQVSEKDYIDIYKTKSIKEILCFLSKPIPFCRYCLPGKEQLTKWETSNKSINEWI